MDDADIEAFQTRRARRIALAMIAGGSLLLAGPAFAFLGPGPDPGSGAGRMWMGALGGATGFGLLLLIPGIVVLVRGKDDGL